MLTTAVYPSPGSGLATDTRIHCSRYSESSRCATRSAAVSMRENFPPATTALTVAATAE
jgi:hypothetical protein